MANFTALAAARRAVLLAHGHDVDRHGLREAPAITVVAGEQAHATLFKALGMLGLGRDRVVRVPVDAEGRMRADSLPRLRGPAIVCTQAGNVNTGAFDPVGAVCDAVRTRRCLGPRGRSVRPVGESVAPARRARRRRRARRFVGDRRPQVAQRALRQRSRHRARSGRARRRDVRAGGLSPRPDPPRSVRVHARDEPPHARRRDLGRDRVARPRRRRGARRAQLPPGAAVRGGPARVRLG